MSDLRPIAFFDSGLGGISVLRETVRLLPEENYLYYGDSLHAPYGVKTVDEVTARSRAIVQHLLDEGAKAIVIACNTATAAAANTLRAEFPDVPIIGTEPALKPAVERHPGGRILVMATAMTVKEQKFQALRAQYEQQAEIIPIPCSGLMEFVEQGILRGEQLSAYLFEKLSPYLKVPVDARCPRLHALFVFAERHPPHRRADARDHRRQLWHCDAAPPPAGGHGRIERKRRARNGHV